MNSVVLSIADFLKNFSPFNHLSKNDLVLIASNIKVVSLEKNKTLFQIDDPLHDSFYVVAAGVINLAVIADAEETLLNKCFEGDIFGLRPFFAKNNYMMTAKAREESLVYAIPIAIFKPFVAQNPLVLDFLLESFANNSPVTNDKNIKDKLLSDKVVYSDQQTTDIQYFQSLSYNRTPLILPAHAIVQDVARLMTESQTNCVIICNSDQIPLGIVTDTEMTSKIGTGRFPLTTTVEKIMNSEMIAVEENISLAEAQLIMLKNNLNHLVVTIDGTIHSEVKGTISEHDLVVSQANKPGVLIKQIKRTENSKDLKLIRNRLTDIVQTSIQKNIPLFHIYTIASEINLALIKRCVELSIVDLGSPPVRFAWLTIGSQGRKEQLLLTDQDSILIFEDVANDKYRDVKDYFLRLSKKTVTKLQEIGYPLCSNGNHASNPLWCKSLTDWSKQYDTWMNTPNKNDSSLSGIFFDFELAFGESKIEETIENLVYKNAQNNVLLYDYLGNEALRNNAPLTFFKKFVVEEEGIHKDHFDIKTRALMPLIDSARMLALFYSIKGTKNTYFRFKQLAKADPKHTEIYMNCAEAFLTLSQFRTMEGLKNETDGQFINLNEMNKTDKERLKNALHPMKDLEELIKDNFQLTQFS